jgi:hypothetical protein
MAPAHSSAEHGVVPLSSMLCCRRAPMEQSEGEDLDVEELAQVIGGGRALRQQAGARLRGALLGFRRDRRLCLPPANALKALGIKPATASRSFRQQLEWIVSYYGI